MRCEQTKTREQLKQAHPDASPLLVQRYCFPRQKRRAHVGLGKDLFWSGRSRVNFTEKRDPRSHFTAQLTVRRARINKLSSGILFLGKGVP